MNVRDRGLSMPLPHRSYSEGIMVSSQPRNVLHMLDANSDLPQKFTEKKSRNEVCGVSKPSYGIPATLIPFDPRDKREGAI